MRGKRDFENGLYEDYNDQVKSKATLNNNIKPWLSDLIIIHILAKGLSDKMKYWKLQQYDKVLTNALA